MAIENMNNQFLGGKQVSVQYAFKKDGKGERHGTTAERLLAAQAKKTSGGFFGCECSAGVEQPAVAQSVPAGELFPQLTTSNDTGVRPPAAATGRGAGTGPHRPRAPGRLHAGERDRRAGGCSPAAARRARRVPAVPRVRAVLRTVRRERLPAAGAGAVRTAAAGIPAAAAGAAVRRAAAGRPGWARAAAASAAADADGLLGAQRAASVDRRTS